MLVSEMHEHTVNEIRPIKTIRIDEGISSSIILQYKQELKSLINEYTKTRNEVYQEFLKFLNINKETELFRNIRIKIGELNSRQRGNFGEWSFWQHGGDIEFENLNSNQHVNVSMHDKESIKPSSLLKYVKSLRHDKLINTILKNDIKSIQKALDLLVIDGFLIDVPNEYGMKILKLKE